MGLLICVSLSPVVPACFESGNGRILMERPRTGGEDGLRRPGHRVGAAPEPHSQVRWSTRAPPSGGSGHGGVGDAFARDNPDLRGPGPSGRRARQTVRFRFLAGEARLRTEAEHRQDRICRLLRVARRPCPSAIASCSPSRSVRKPNKTSFPARPSYLCAIVSGPTPAATVLFISGEVLVHCSAKPDAGEIAWYGGRHDTARCRLRKRPRFTRTARLICSNGNTTDRHVHWHKRFYNPDGPSGVLNCEKLCLLGTQQFTRWSNAANFRAASILRRGVWSGISPKSRCGSRSAAALPMLL